MVHTFVRSATVQCPWFAAARLAVRLRRNGWKSHVKHVGFERCSVYGCPPHYLWS